MTPSDRALLERPAAGIPSRPQSEDPLLESEGELIGACLALTRRGRLSQLSDSEAALADSDVTEPGPARLHRIKALIREGKDPLGDAFTALRSPAERRKLGAVYTPAAIVDSMVEWLARHCGCTRIVDPGAGSGRFLLAAAQRFPEAELVAVEIDPLAALMARASLTAAGLDGRVIVGGYRDAPIGPAVGRTAFIGNPPYVRHHDIKARWKDWYAAVAGEHGLPASKLAGLHMHFFLATLRYAAPGDVGAFVTASEWLDVNYGHTLRQMMAGALGGVSVTVIDPQAQPFPGTAATAAVSCFQVGSEPAGLRLRRVSDNAELGSLDDGKHVSQQRLLAARRWTPLLRATRRSMPEGYVELGELCRVHRGAVTGSNATWITGRSDSCPRRADLPPSVLFPAVTWARELFDAGVAITSTSGFRSVIDLPVDLGRFSPSERLLIERFLNTARRAGVHKGYVARHRKAWWSVGLREPAPILATYMARRAPAFVRNLAGLRNVNVVHGLYPRESLDADQLDRLAAALRNAASTDQGRTYAGGLTKFEPRDMERIHVPGPQLLTETASS